MQWLLLIIFATCVPLNNCNNEVISVFGSSVANGYLCTGNCSGNSIESDEGGCYQSRLRVFQRDQKKRAVFNNAHNGDTTVALLQRFSEMLSVHPTYVIFALSLANEGILNGNPQAVYDQYASNMQILLNQSRSYNITPVLLSCYPHGSYGPTEYDYITRMNILSQTWGVAQVNLLGAVDDGSGKWANGFWGDALHPNDMGSTLMYRTFIPSLFEAIQSGKSSLIPRITNKYATLSRFSLSGYSVTFYVPTEAPIFPWAVCLWIRTPSSSSSLPSGDILVISSNSSNGGGDSSIVLGVTDGKLTYKGVAVNSSGGGVEDGEWHYVILSHKWAISTTSIYLDGVLLGQATEAIAPSSFSLGVSSNGALLDVRELSIYRSSLSQAEVTHMSTNSSFVLPASLEIYTPLDFSSSSSSSSSPAFTMTNYAQSMSELTVTFTRPSVDISVFGSSVANGYTCTGNCSGTSSSSEDGGCYQSRFRIYQQHTYNHTLFNNARNGDTTNLLLSRFSEVLSVNPRYMLIGLSLANEGLIDPSASAQDVYNHYADGMQQLINTSYENNILPFIGSCYPHNWYNLTQYSYITRMNLESQTWGVPQINFLGAIDDGTGKWAPGFFSNEGHPNDLGSTLMYHAIVPSLLEAIASGKPARVWRRATTNTNSNSESFSSLTFTTTPPASIYSFAITLSLRVTNDSLSCMLLTLPLVSDSSSSGAPAAVIGLQNGYVHYRNTVRSGPLDDGKWHTVVISHKWAINQTTFYLDGVALGQVAERIQPSQVILSAPPEGLELTDWTIYRSSLSDPEVGFLLNSSYILQASLEVYAPLDSANVTANYAQSMSTLQLTLPPRHSSVEEQPETKSRTNDYLAVGVFSAVVSLGCLVGAKFLSRAQQRVKVNPY